VTPVNETISELDRWLPPRGPCLICGVPGADARHRIIDAIREQATVGADPEDIARELDLPIEAINAALNEG
jgi:hypothetical protein